MTVIMFSTNCKLNVVECKVLDNFSIEPRPRQDVCTHTPTTLTLVSCWGVVWLMLTPSMTYAAVLMSYVLLAVCMLQCFRVGSPDWMLQPEIGHRLLPQ